MPLVEPKPEQVDPMLNIAVAACAIVAGYWGLTWAASSPVVTALMWAVLNSLADLCLWVMLAGTAWAAYFVAQHIFGDKFHKRGSVRSKLALAAQALLGIPWAQSVLVLGVTDTTLPFLPTKSLVQQLGKRFDFPDTTKTRLLLWGIASASLQCVHMAISAALLPSETAGQSQTTWRECLQGALSMVQAAAGGLLRRRPKPQSTRRKSNQQSSTDPNRSKDRTSNPAPKASNNSNSQSSRAPPAKSTATASSRTSTSASTVSSSCAPSSSPTTPQAPTATPGPSPQAPTRKNSKKGRAALRAVGSFIDTSCIDAAGGPSASSSASSSVANPASASPDPAQPSTTPPEPPGAGAPSERSGWLSRITSWWSTGPAPAAPVVTAGVAASNEPGAAGPSARPCSAKNKKTATSAGDKQSCVVAAAVPPDASGSAGAGGRRGCVAAAAAAPPDASGGTPATAPAAAAAAASVAAASASASPSPSPSPSDSPSASASDCKETTSGACAVCLENAADAGFLHGASLHQCVCRSCAAAFKLGQECPLCRAPIERVVEIFACTG